jgi:ATP/maltotriose-dependent transcriptional regulator MalT
MATPQLAKLTPPRLGKVYLRTRLFDRLSAVRRSHPVLWIGAPAGAGKTTLVATYLATHSIRPLWYSVDVGDAEPASFFYYFGLAAKQAGIRKPPPLFTSEYQKGLPVFARSYFRELFARVKKPAVIVLDNCQDSGENTPLQIILQHALEEIPPEIYVILISRTRPPQEFARLLANNAIEQLDWEDLRLDEMEHRALIATMLDDQPPNAKQIQALFDRTQGWVTGVVLALKRNMLADESNHDLVSPDQLYDQEQMFDYFATQVLARTDEGTREFLYAVSFLPAMTASQCEALTGNTAARTILKRLEKNYFFTTRRGILNVIYAFHPLFRQFLQTQAERHFTEERKTALQVQSATLALQSGEVEQAVDLLKQTGQWAQLTELIRQRGSQLVKQGRHILLRDWIEALPATQRKGDTWIRYWHAAAILPDDPFGAYELFSRIYAEFSRQDNAVGMYISWIGAAESLFFRHDEMQPVKHWITELEQLRARHPRYPSLEIRGKFAILALNIMIVACPDYPGLGQWLKTAQRMYRLVPLKEVRCFIALTLIWYYSMRLDMARCTLLVEEIRPLLKSSTIAPAARLQGINAVLLIEWLAGNRQGALRTIDFGLELAENSGIFYALHLLYSTAFFVHLSYGDEARAVLMSQRFHDMIDPRQKVSTAHHYFQLGWLAVARHQFQTAKTYLLQAYELLKPIHFPWQELHATGGLTHVCIELEEFDTAMLYLNIARQLADQMNNPVIKSYYCNYLEAYWHDGQGNTAQAVSALHKAFSTARKENIYAFVLWEISMISRLCMLALQHDIEPDYVRRLITIYGYTPSEHSVPIEQWPYPVKIYSLGHFSLRIDDKVQDLSGKSAARPMDLLKCLIALGARNVSQAKLIHALWPEAEVDAGIKSFHTTLYRLRKLITIDDAIVLKDGLLSLDRRLTWVDVWTLEGLLTQLDKAIEKADKPDGVERLSGQMMQHYRGPFLGQEEDHIWMLAYRDRLHSRILRTLKQLGRFWLDHDHVERAIAAYDHVLELDRLHEPAYQHLMRLYLHQGRHAEAVATYERCRKTLSNTLGVMPSEQTIELYNRIYTAAQSPQSHSLGM